MTQDARSLRFPVLFTGINRAMVALGVTRTNSFVELADDELVVRLGWLFRARVPIASVRSVAPDHDRVFGWGAHGWRGVWLVNGSSRNIVRIGIEPVEAARVCGVSVRLSVLRVSVEDPAGLLQAFRDRGLPVS